MAIESAADRLAFLDVDEFGTTATVGAFSVIGIFDDAYQAINQATGEVTTTAPQFLCRSADVTTASIASNTSLVIGGVTYKAIDLQPDGTGMTTILLSKDAP